jgi:RNA polymerase sigma-70 factor (ECF subfamily)
LAHDREAQWKELMLASRRGDEAAYRKLLGSITDYLRGWAQAALRRAGRSPAEAEDIVQETLIAIHTRRHSWDADQPFGPWLHGVARHKLVDALRRRTGHDHLAIDDFADVMAAPPTNAHGGSGLAGSDILRMIATLPARQARIVSAIFVEGQCTADVAGTLGMSQGAVRVALHRALRTLAGAFGKGADHAH